MVEAEGWVQDPKETRGAGQSLRSGDKCWGSGTSEGAHPQGPGGCGIREAEFSSVDPLPVLNPSHPQAPSVWNQRAVEHVSWRKVAWCGSRSAGRQIWIQMLPWTHHLGGLRPVSHRYCTSVK